MRLTTEQAQTLADLSAKEGALCALEADGVPEDDPRHMEARAAYDECLANVEGAGIPGGTWFLAETKGGEPVAYTAEPEAD